MITRVSIVGGCGAMGKWIINFLRKIEGLDIIVADPDEIEGIKLSKAMGIKYEKDNKKAVVESEIVIVSVPVEIAPEVIAEVAPCMKDGSLLMDITSVKTEVISAMLKHAPPTVELVSIHPMFGPRVKDIKGQVIAMIPVRSEKWFNLIKGFLEGKGAEVIVTTVKQHDEMMSIVQGLTHFTSMVFAGVMRDMGVDLEQTRKFSTPVYNALLSIAYRVICQNPELYARLQVHNPYVLDVQEAFITQAVNLYVETKAKNINGMVDQVVSSCRHFASTGSPTMLLSMSDKMVLTLQRERNALEGLIGKKICLENLRTGSVHLGILRSVSTDAIEIEESKKRRVNLNLLNVMFLDDRTTKEVRRNIFGESSLDFSVILPSEFDHDFCKEILEKFLPEAVRVEVLEIYAGEQIQRGFKSVTLRVFFLKDEDPMEISAKVRKILKRLGGRLR